MDLLCEKVIPELGSKLQSQLFAKLLCIIHNIKIGTISDEQRSDNLQDADAMHAACYLLFTITQILTMLLNKDDL